MQQEIRRVERALHPLRVSTVRENALLPALPAARHSPNKPDRRLGLIQALTRQMGALFFALFAIVATTPAHADEKVFAGITYKIINHKWSAHSWSIWALPGHVCVAMIQDPDITPFKFWGFRVVDGLQAQMIFGSIADARPQTIQISYNDGPLNNRAATVEAFTDWNGYVIPFAMEDLWAMPDEISFTAYAGKQKVMWNLTSRMGEVALTLEKCDKWQQAH